MADFNSSFLDHLKKSEQERKKEFMKFSGVKKKKYVYPGEKLLRKYKIWRKKPYRRKGCTEINHHLAKTRYRNRYSWPIENTPKTVVNKRHSFDSSLLPDISRCQDFPMSEIGTELSGNRNNGNSPFNSSNSCSSPPDSQLICKMEKSVVSCGQNDKSLCKKCVPTNSEQNNNSDSYCTCIAENLHHSPSNVETRPKAKLYMESEKSEKTDSGISYSGDNRIKDEMNLETKVEETEISTQRTLVNLGSEEIPASDNDTAGEAYIDVESLDDSSEVKHNNYTTSSIQKVTEVFQNGIVHEQVQYVGSNVKHSQPSTQIAPVKWQQQFMSFLSSATASEEDLEDVTSTSHHSPRRKRSRKVRQSLCPCCVGTGGHHKKRDKSEDLVKQRRSHSMMRDHRRFIRDMTQLVSLRNKVMAVCKLLFPQCVGEVFNYANPDSEDVDKCIDQMISILHSAHQKFLHNLNSKSEICRSANSHKKFKSERTGNLKYDQINSNEFLVSICDPSKPLVNNSELQDSSEYLSLDESSHPPVLFCSQTEKMDNSEDEEQPSLFSNLCLPDVSEGIVYAIPFENGIAYPDKTQVLLPGDDSHNLDFVHDHLGNAKSENLSNIDVDECKDHGRILSEADSGIVNDHEMSSPEDHDRSTAWTDSNLKSKTSPDCAKSENTANIFDLFSKYEPLCPKVEEKPKSDHKVFNSSPEVKKVENKSPVKTGDRNIFESLFSMNMETSVSPPKYFEKNEENSDEEIESFYLPLHKRDVNNIGSILPCHEEIDKQKEIFIEVYDPAIVLCKKPKICVKAFKEKISVLLRCLLPEITFEKNFFKNTDNLEYVLDALILSNQKETHVS